MDQSEFWCDIVDICMAEIERRAVIASNVRYVSEIYISVDLLSTLTKMMAPMARNTIGSSSNVITSLMCSTGHLLIVKVPKLRNFIFIGSEVDYKILNDMGIDYMFLNSQEKQRVDKEFEEIVLNET